MRHRRVLSGLAVFGLGCSPMNAPLPAPDRVQWAQSIGGPGEEVPQSLSVGPLEQGVLAIRSDGPLELGGRRFEASRLPRTVLVRFDRDGVLTPLTSLSPGDQEGLVDLFEIQVASDAVQNLVLAGSFAGADFVLEDGAVLERQDSDGFEPFVALLAPDGSTIWAQRGRQGRIQQLAVGPEGLWVAGRAAGSVGFEDFDADTGAGDAFVARFGASGRLEVFVALSASGLRIDDLDLDAGGVYVAGRAGGSLTLSTDLDPHPGPGPFVARLDARTGVPDWVASALLAPGTASIRKVQARDGGAFVLGRYSGQPPELPPGTDDVWVGRFDDRGAFTVVRSLAVRGQLSLSSAAADRAGGLWISGSFRDQLRFGDVTLDSEGGLVGFLGRLDADGRPDWLETLGAGPGVRAAAELATTPSGDVVLVGVFEDQVSLLDRELLGAGETDVLVVRYEGR